MSEILNCLNTIIDNTYERIESIKRQYGIIKKIIVIEDTNKMSAKVKVKIRDISEDDLTEEYIDDDPDEKNWLTMLNKTGQILKVGDAVWVYYWRSITDGYVAIKIGNPRQNNSKVSLEKAMSITDHQDTIDKISDETASFPIQNKVTRSCGNIPNTIYVGGCPAVYYPNVSELPFVYSGTTSSYSPAQQQQVRDFKSFILSLNSNLFVKDVSSVYVDGIGGDSSYYRHRDYHFGWLDRSDLVYYDGGTKLDDDSTYNQFINFYNYFLDGIGFLPGVMYYTYTTDLLGSTLQDDKLDDPVVFDSYSSAVNGGLIFVYDEIVFDSSAMWAPYGYLRGRWALRTFSQGVLINSGYQQSYSIISIPDDYLASTASAFAFANKDEREYARQTLSRVESLPY